MIGREANEGLHTGKHIFKPCEQRKTDLIRFRAQTFSKS